MLFVGQDVVHAERGEIVHGCAEADRFRDSGRACLKLVGERVPLAAFERDALDHIAAAHVRGHFLQQLTLAVENADPGWPGHLVPGEHQEVRVERLDIYREMRDALRAIEDEQRSGGMSLADHVLDRVDCAEHVADMDHANQLDRLIAQQAGVRFLIQLTGVCNRHVANLKTAFLSQNLPGHDIGVMLHSGP